MTLPLISIDGPAGAGKTSTSRAVAKRLGVPYLDTGAMYRAVTYAVMKKNVSYKDIGSIKRLLSTVNFSFSQGKNGTHVWMDEEEITDKLRSPELTRKISDVCEIREVRDFLVKLQRKWADRGFGVVEGRDIGTVVLPQAPLKVFMTAKPEIRALRRGKDLGIAEDSKALEQISKELSKRDKRDMEREESPLKPAKNAVVVDTSDVTFEEQVNKIVRLAAEKFDLKLYTAKL